MSESSFTIRVWSDDSPISTVLETTCTCREAVDIFKDVLNKVYGLESDKPKCDSDTIAPAHWELDNEFIRVWYPNCGPGIEKINQIYGSLKDRLNVQSYVSVGRYLSLCGIPVPDHHWWGRGWDSLPCGAGEDNIDISHDARLIWLKMPKWETFEGGKNEH